MGEYAFFVLIGCLVMIAIVGKLFLWPIKKVVKLVVNSVLGGIMIYVVNFIGSGFGFHIGINWWTLLCTGILGVPGVILLIFLNL